VSDEIQLSTPALTRTLVESLGGCVWVTAMVCSGVSGWVGVFGSLPWCVVARRNLISSDSVSFCSASSPASVSAVSGRLLSCSGCCYSYSEHSAVVRRVCVSEVF